MCDAFAPVVMFGFNRPKLQAMSLRQFSQCDGADERDVYVFIDGARNERDEILGNQIEMLVKKYSRKFSRMRIVRREKNLGCRGNIVAGISEIISRYGKAIMIEDDILVSKTFLRFMDRALVRYRNDERIWNINGYQKYFLRIPFDYPYDVYYNYIMCAWGWATWKDRWFQVDFDMKDWPSYRSVAENIERVNDCGLRIVPLLDSQYAGILKTWDVQCMYHMIKNRMYAIEPKFQLSKNIGCIAGGEHFSKTDHMARVQRYYNFMPRLDNDVPIDGRIMGQYRCASYDPHMLQRITRRMSRILAMFKRTQLVPIG